FKCFLDAYKGYHQIQLAEADEEADEENKTFHTGQGVYCYTKMPFGLKNAGATYQRLMDKAFESQVGRSIKVYVDDLVVKSHTKAEMVRDIEETFRTLRKVNIKLNPKKCRSVELQLPSPQTVKEVQSLNGKLASLNRFLSKSAKKSLPLFQTLKKCIKKSDFRWTAKAEQAFQQLKQHLSELPLLVAPKPQEELIMYLSATYGAVSAVMTRPDMAGRLQKWSIMLREHNITYRPRTSVKGQILADFLIEMPGNVSQAAPAAVTQEEPLTLFTDGSSCVDGSGAGLIFTNPEGVEFTYALRFQFAASNNEAEYEAHFAGLRIATQMGVKNIQVNVDSKLVAIQVLGTYVAKEDNMIKYLEIVKGLVSGFTTFSISQVPRSKNKQADPLSKTASTSFAHLSKQVLVEVLENKSIKEKEVAAVIEEDGPTWMTQITDYLKEGVLPGDNKEARKLRLKARQYALMKGVLYRRSFLTPWLRCVGPLQADCVMREIYEGSCSMHAGPRLLPGAWKLLGLSGEGSGSRGEVVELGWNGGSRALQGPELNYSPMEKLVLSLVFAAKRLRQYFQAHPITVITDQPIKQVMTRPDAAGRLQKWSIMLGEHNITYRPRTSIKGKILADFLTEMSGDVSQAASAAAAQEEPWTLFTDGSSCVDGSGAGLILTNPQGVNVDSKLVANQVLRTSVAKEDNMIKYLEIVRGLVLVEVLENKSIKEKEVAAVIEEDGPTWMTHIADYLKEGVLPGDNKEARKLRLEADYVMREIHEGSCSMHTGPRSVVAKAIRLGYYWPTMHKDARDMIWKCNDCQIHRPVTRHPQQSLTPITAPWPFYKWGIDIAGPFSEGPGKVKFLIVEMDYFTKWVEAKAVATITGGQVKKFVWDNIVCHFEIKMPTYRTAAVDVVNNDKELRLNLDLLEERRERAAICEARAKSKMMKYYNARVRGVAFKPGDFVYRNNDASHAVAGGKLGPKWEGLYEVTEALGNEA
nr:reverse transcriptase domain-containing protein [Tanacetum cinerariifolium]